MDIKDKDKLIEDITNNVIKALSNNIGSIIEKEVNEQLRNYSNGVESKEDYNKLFNASREQINKLQDSLSHSDDDYEVVYNFHNNGDKGIDVYIKDKKTGKVYAFDMKKTKDNNRSNLVEKYRNIRALYNNFIYNDDDNDDKSSKIDQAIQNLLTLNTRNADFEDEDYSKFKVKSRVKEELDDQGITIAWLIRQTGIPKSTMNSIIYNTNEVSLTNAYKIASVLGMKIEQLFTWEKEEQNID